MQSTRTTQKCALRVTGTTQGSGLQSTETLSAVHRGHTGISAAVLTDCTWMCNASHKDPPKGFRCWSTVA
ncbi:hypothetical protein BgiBS90_023946 [Biomphalaria glabrata]|nr:hypothetical protein BgiBS90_023946 [Biomphalaria glabrata]